MSHENYTYLIKDLKHGYGGDFTLDIPHLVIERGGSVGLIGPNGCGKTTLLRILAFLEKFAGGEVFFEGKSISNDYSKVRQKVTLVMQDPYLLKRSVFENVAYGLKVRGLKDNLKARVYEALEWVGLDPKTFARRRWFELSGGEGQRVSLASRLVLRPEVLFLDEPTANVDARSAALIKDAIDEIRSRFETTLVFASHDLIWLGSVTDKILRLYDGRIVGSGRENVIQGPWRRDEESIWIKELQDGGKISATKPPHTNAAALLHPSDILLAVQRPSSLSARNILGGEIVTMSAGYESGTIQIDVRVSGMTLVCSLTRKAVEELNLLPGKNIFVIFKASSLLWL